MIQLGNEVKDTISGLTGIATGRAEYLFGCARVLVEPMACREGKPCEGQWLDEQRIVTTKKRSIKVSPESYATSGGPQMDAPKH